MVREKEDNGKKHSKEKRMEHDEVCIIKVGPRDKRWVQFSLQYTTCRLWR